MNLKLTLNKFVSQVVLIVSYRSRVTYMVHNILLYNVNDLN